MIKIWVLIGFLITSSSSLFAVDKDDKLVPFKSINSLAVVSLGMDIKEILTSPSLTLDEKFLEKNKDHLLPVLSMSSKYFLDLKKLDCTNCNIGDEGAKLLSSSKFPSLEELILKNTQIGDSGARSLSTGKFLPLKNLNLENNIITNNGCKELAEGSYSKYNAFPSLEYIHIGGNPVSYNGIETLINAFPNIKKVFNNGEYSKDRPATPKKSSGSGWCNIF